LEKKKVIISMIFLLFFVAFVSKSDENQIKKIRGLDEPFTSDSAYFSFITPSIENESITQFCDYTINVSDDLNSLNFKIKIWKDNIGDYEWKDMIDGGDFWTYLIDPINYSNGNWNVTIKCQYSIVPELWDNDTRGIYIDNDRPNITIVKPIGQEEITSFYGYTINATIKDSEGDPFNATIEIYNSQNALMLSDNLTNYTSDKFSYEIDPIDYSNDQYRLKIIANDSKGEAYKEVIFKINNTRPTIQMIKPHNLEIITSKLSIVNVTITDREGDSISNVRLKIFESNPNSPIIDWVSMSYHNGYYNYTIDYSDIENGDYNMLIECSDAKGSVSKQVLFTLNIDSSGEADENEEDDGSNGSNEDVEKDGFNIWIPIISGILSAIAGLLVRGGYKKLKKNKEKIKKIPKALKNTTSNIKARKIKSIPLPKKDIETKFQWDDIDVPKKRSNVDVEALPLTAKERNELKKTEEEVNVEKKRFKCVVHKGIIDGNIYVCPFCQTTYCQKCAEVLKEKGENCWSCEKPIQMNKKKSERTSKIIT